MKGLLKPENQDRIVTLRGQPPPLPLSGADGGESQQGSSAPLQDSAATTKGTPASPSTNSRGGGGGGGGSGDDGIGGAPSTNADGVPRATTTANSFATDRSWPGAPLAPLPLPTPTLAPELPQLHYSAVFDGHGGAEASTQAAGRLQHIVVAGQYDTWQALGARKLQGGGRRQYDTWQALGARKLAVIGDARGRG